MMGFCRRLRCLEEKALLTRSTENCGAVRLPDVASTKTLISCCCFWAVNGVIPDPEMRVTSCKQHRNYGSGCNDKGMCHQATGMHAVGYNVMQLHGR